MLKSVDFRNSEYSVDNWNYLLDIASYLIASNPSLKGVISAYYGKNMCISDLPLIVKFYEILSGNNNTFDLLIRHVLMDKTNFFPLLKFLKSSAYSKELFAVIVNEFMASESTEREIFLVQLALCRNRNICDIICNKLRIRAIDYCLTGNWDLLYKNLMIHTLTKTVPHKLKQQFDFLCDICNFESAELKLELDVEDFLEHERDFRPCFKELFLLTGKATPFNCLTQLLKLLEQLYPSNRDEIHYFVSYIRKRKISVDAYFNLSFIE